MDDRFVLLTAAQLDELTPINAPPRCASEAEACFDRLDLLLPEERTLCQRRSAQRVE